MDVDSVADALREVAESEVRPRFTATPDGADPTAPRVANTVALDADRIAEAALGERLRAILDVPVLGEEAAVAHPSLVAHATHAPAAWVVDPIDGTVNFTQGHSDYAMMVALIDHGVSVAGWVYMPETGDMYIAEKGAGATLNGARLQVEPPAGGLETMRASFASFYFPARVRDVLKQNGGRCAEVVAPRLCAGWDHAGLLTGATDVLVFWGTKLWDHAPTCVIAREAGCRVARPDGRDYQPGKPGEGLVVAHASAWRDAATLFSGAEL